MRDVDLLLRMIAFSMRMHSYRGNLKQFLDETQQDLNRSWSIHESAVTAMVIRIEDGLRLLKEWFGDARKVGRRWSTHGYEKPINRAILDVQVASALDTTVRDAVKDGRLNFEACFIELSEDSLDFFQAISGTTKSVAAVRARFAAWQQTLETALGEPIHLARLPSA
jgi:hypothetical protein